MFDNLFSAWRARHVLLIGEADGATAWMRVLLGELGAEATCLPVVSDAEALCRAMTACRISAVVVPAAHRLCPGGDLPQQLLALQTLLGEAQEAGIPLVILCSDVNVYRAQHRPWHVSEDDPIGGQTREGLFQSILQLYADGVSRGLCADAVRVLCVRHMPCLGSDAPCVAQYSRWCRALLGGDVVPIEHPTRRGVFLHPLDAACGALLLGARIWDDEALDGGVYNLGANPESVCPNRTAALHLIERCGGTRPIVESEPPLFPGAPLLDGSRAQKLIGRPEVLAADEALSMLFAIEQAAQLGPQALCDEQIRQTHEYLHRLLHA